MPPSKSHNDSKCSYCKGVYSKLAQSANQIDNPVFRAVHEQNCLNNQPEEDEESPPTPPIAIKPHTPVEVDPRAKEHRKPTADPVVTDEVSEWQSNDEISTEHKELFDYLNKTELINPKTQRLHKGVLSKSEHKKYFGVKPFYLFLEHDLWKHYGDTDRLPMQKWRAISDGSPGQRHYQKYDYRIPLPQKALNSIKFKQGQERAVAAHADAPTASTSNSVPAPKSSSKAAEGSVGDSAASNADGTPAKETSDEEMEDDDEGEGKEGEEEIAPSKSKSMAKEASDEEMEDDDKGEGGEEQIAPSRSESKSKVKEKVTPSKSKAESKAKPKARGGRKAKP